jgi:hypothetical protein
MRGVALRLLSFGNQLATVAADVALVLREQFLGCSVAPLPSEGKGQSANFLGRASIFTYVFGRLFAGGRVSSG